MKLFNRTIGFFEIAKVATQQPHLRVGKLQSKRKPWNFYHVRLYQTCDNSLQISDYALKYSYLPPQNTIVVNITYFKTFPRNMKLFDRTAAVI